MVLTYIIINITALLIGLLDLSYHQYHSSSYRTCCVTLSSVSQLFLSDLLHYIIVSITALLIGLVALHYHQYHSSSYQSCCVTLSSVSQLFLSDLLRYFIISITALLIGLVALHYRQYHRSSYQTCCITGDNDHLNLQNCHYSIYKLRFYLNSITWRLCILFKFFLKLFEISVV